MEAASAEPRKEERKAERTPEEDNEAEVGAAVAKVGIFAMIIGIFFHILRMIKGRKTTKTN
jgi:uncharacterized membrane protein